MIHAGMACANEASPPREVDHAGLFQAAMTGQHIRAFLVADDFEEGVVREATHDPIGNETGARFTATAPRLRAILTGVDPAGRAGLSVNETRAASGSRSIRLQDSTTVNAGFAPALSWRLYGADMPRDGHLALDFDLLIPEAEGAAFAVMVRDYTGRYFKPGQSYQSHVELGCAGGRMVLDGASLEVVSGTWMHVHLLVPLGGKGGRVKLVVTDPRAGIQSIEQPLGHVAEAVSMVGMFLPESTDGHVFLDNIVIKTTE